jgi:hypothetical protein
MKINKDKLETFGAYSSILFVFFLLIVIPNYCGNEREKRECKIIKEGKFTIGFVYETNTRANANAHLKVFGLPQANNKLYIYPYPKIKPLLKFYKVYYLPNDKNKSAVDFSHEIPIDSVQYYFPKGQNPFKEEIEAIKEGRYKVSGGF